MVIHPRSPHQAAPKPRTTRRSSAPCHPPPSTSQPIQKSFLKLSQALPRNLQFQIPSITPSCAPGTTHAYVHNPSAWDAIRFGRSSTKDVLLLTASYANTKTHGVLLHAHVMLLMGLDTRIKGPIIGCSSPLQGIRDGIERGESMAGG
jgi:hypothetical protein